MNGFRRLATFIAIAAFASFEAGAEPVVDAASAIAAARKYTKARCPAETPCKYKPRREGTNWNVWVEFTRHGASGGKPKPYPGGHVVLYFDAEGNMVRRIEGQ